jgi:AcrR family transcriptional regulator
MTGRSTSERILDAAERLFADHGFTATSMRQITTEARANLAAVNYHFGSKDKLIRAVFARRLEPLNRERLELLTHVENEAEGGTLVVDRIVEAFIGPALRLKRVRGGEVFLRLLGHTLSQREDRMRTLLTDQFREVIGRFTAALGRALPHLSAEDVFWRLLFTVGAMAHTLALSDTMPAFSQGVCRSPDEENTLRRLVPFVSAGLRAPVPKLEGVP